MKVENAGTYELSLYRERNNRLRFLSMRFFHLRQQLLFQVIGIGHHLAGRNLLIRRAVKAQLAHSQPTPRSHRRTKGTASHRPRIIELAKSCRWIEHRTGRIVGEFCEALFSLRAGLEHLRIEHARFYITRELACKSLNRILRSLANLARPLGI